MSYLFWDAVSVFYSPNQMGWKIHWFNNVYSFIISQKNIFCSWSSIRRYRNWLIIKASAELHLSSNRFYLWRHYSYHVSLVGIAWQSPSLFRSALNSKFSFYQTSCRTKIKEPSLPYYLPRAWKKNSWIHTFSQLHPLCCQYLSKCKYIQFFYPVWLAWLHAVQTCNLMRHKKKCVKISYCLLFIYLIVCWWSDIQKCRN